MPTFSYTAIEAGSGREQHGLLESPSVEGATADLKARGLAPMSLAVTSRQAGARNPAGKKLDNKRSGRGEGKFPHAAAHPPKRRRMVFGRIVRAKELALFTRQLSTLVKAGMPLLRALEVLARQQRNPEFRRVIEEVAGAIRSGGNLSDGLQLYPRIFDQLYVNMVRAGEAGGVLGTVLDRLAHFREKAERIKGKVKSAMTYPAIVILLAVAIVSALMVFVVPKFEQIFAGLLKGQPLPALTRAVLGVSYFVKHNVLMSLGVLVAVYLAYIIFRRTRFGVRVLDWLALRLPVLGDLCLKAAIARFTRTLGTLLASGVPILQALVITREASGNVWVSEAIHVVHDRVKEGDNIAGPLEATAIFPAMVTSMIDVGEETGSLPEMLTRVAETYDEEVDNAVAALTSLLEPFMIVLLALLVGTIVIALFLPIVSIIQHLQ